ncbi:right-handed parallel beta-helix repeat-containing protein [Sphingobium sp. EM0848]|uniref:calcium-binding protein n=1 Tax=Sphingobium sp. EM0848 TaxID=2743473 RepID=UPI00159C1E71|nr:right-handed parallel beta-helix repeat-containing protein [Sphingobium sp. EM0848]
MSDIIVKDSAALVAAVKSAKNGDTILLSQGTYQSVDLSGIKIDGNVTIKSLDVSNQASLLDLTVKSSSGLTFENLCFTPQSADRLYTFNVTSSSNIHFDSIEVVGPDGATGYQSAPFLIRGSENVSVTNSEFHHLWNGVSVLDSSYVTVTGNYFHDIRTDGFRGGGVSNLVVSGNYMTDFHPATGDHPDGIQLWTTNTTASAHDIVITDNIITRGDGAAVQGIFLRDQVGTLPYENVTITGNLVLGGMYNGIAVGHLDGATITGNTVIGLPDQKSWIRVDDTSHAVVSDNVSTSYILSSSNVGLVTSNNSTAAVPSDGGDALFASWLLQHQSQLAGLDNLLSGILNLTVVEKPATLPSDAVTVPAVEEQVTAPVVVPHSTITGTAMGETLKVAAVGDSDVFAGAGNDIIHGGAGHNNLYGGTGDDIYHVKGTGDTVIELAGQGSDTVYAYIDYKLTDNVETLRMAKEGLVGQGNDLDNRIVGSAGVDILYGHGGNDMIQGEGGDDVIYGGAGDDKLLGGDGNDRLYGGDGNDTLSGGAGNDVIDGGAGNDRIEGDGGDDILTGGAGADLFNFRDVGAVGATVITDFSSAQKDKIGLSLIDANIHTAANDAFKFIGTAAFSKVAGQLRYEVVNGDSHVSGDVNGDGIADFTIVLQHVDTLRASDFIL